MQFRKVLRWSFAAALVIGLTGCPLDPNTPPDVPASRLEAWRFLTQATFGPTDNDVDHLMTLGYSAWIDEQLAMSSKSTFRAFYESRSSELASGKSPGADQIYEAFYTRALTDPAQLRNRILFALSEMFVVSMADTNIAAAPQLMVGYLDTLDQAIGGNYRQLLSAVTTSPAMGRYLTFRSNEKEDDSFGRLPDENYAREVMQLFSIGLYQLNGDGTVKLDGSGKPIETYTSDDVRGLSKVFTGWSNTRTSAFASAAAWQCFYVTSACDDPQARYLPMVTYDTYHSVSAKSFLGVTIAAGSTPDTLGDTNKALDTLASHANTAPNISKQLIQRFVTSNPSPAYVQRVANTFTTSSGNIGQVVKAILTDTEARTAATMAGQTQGKLREPVLRLTALMRAFTVRSNHLPDPSNPSAGVSGTTYVPIHNTSDSGTGLNQTPFNSPSVFNFFRPGYVMPQSATSKLSMVAPEFQLVSESSITGYVNYVRDLLTTGIGESEVVNGVTVAGIKLDVSDQRALAYDPTTLIQQMANKLLGGSISANLSQTIQTVLGTMPVPSANADNSNGDAINTALDTRVKATILLIAASPEFLIQR